MTIRVARVSGPSGAALALLLTSCSGLEIATSSAPTFAPPTDLAVFDFDGDGKDDVVASHRDSTRLGVHRVGEWAASYFPLDAVPRALAGIGQRGFVASFPQTGAVAVMRRDGAGLDRVVVHDGEPSPLDVVVADFDRDGMPDIAIAGELLLLVFQRADGSFDAPLGVPLDPRPRTRPTLALTDLDRDGTIDLLCGMATGDPDDAVPDHLRAFRNAPHGRLADESWYRVPWPERVAAGDLDGDGLADAVAFGRDGVWVFFGLGHGWLGPPRRIASGRMSDGLVTDVDGDGRDDVVALEHRRHTLALQLSVGPQQFAPARRITVGRSPTRVVALTHDDATVLVTAHADGLAVVSAARNAPR